jgi:hypothetical protein
VQRRELNHFRQFLDHRVVDQDGFAELRPTVDDAVTDGDNTGSVAERSERARSLAGVDHAELETGRTGVDDQDVRAQYGQIQSRMDGSSSPWARV